MPYCITLKIVHAYAGTVEEQSLAGGSSPDLLKKPSVRDISTVLGLGGIQNWETYSRKVFVGGLPPEVDEGMQKFAAFLFIHFVL